MKSSPILLWAFALFLLSALGSPVAAGRISLRPLSPSELRSALHDVTSQGVERSPDGRSVSSALAALKGFALGVTNGIGGALLYDVATSNETIAYLSNLFDQLNTTLSSYSTSGSSSSSNDEGTVQEVCFSSRSLNGDAIQARYNNDENDEELDDDQEFYDDEQEEEPEEQLREVDYSDNSIGNALTCIVVNTGQAILRHRRSLDNEQVTGQDGEVIFIRKAAK
ncbi:uncharacterized protein LOC133845322 [Drosophila sulfurigaster albostrigata]|uniref:uncharacterized protein LOC133845322 n=1 Tax=Drosophila sulfurigaster albostrigata TaxID=89887 RepID=UPI002D21D9FB|nr:uncharacterized protein LOC133845322 [Drosophila sulfurigaster albostrigata]XP_062135737.1 uncharacterized protein LOC133845322 [Drosophila sulfurigaster albostrigata]